MLPRDLKRQEPAHIPVAGPNSTVTKLAEPVAKIRRSEWGTDCSWEHERACRRFGDAVSLIGQLIKAALLTQSTSKGDRLSLRGHRTTEVMGVTLARLCRKRRRCNHCARG